MSTLRHVADYTHMGQIEKGRVVKTCDAGLAGCLRGALPPRCALPRDIYVTKAIGRMCCSG
jgi:hypothetical protein